MADIVRQYFDSPSVDMVKANADAFYWQEKGEASLVHAHTYTEGCNDRCKTYDPDGDQNAAPNSGSKD